MNLVSADQRDWADYVGRVDFGYNVANVCLFFSVAYEVGTLQHANLAIEFNKDGEILAKIHEHFLENTKLLLETTRTQYEEQVNAGKCEMEDEVGQKGCC